MPDPRRPEARTARPKIARASRSRPLQPNRDAGERGEAERVLVVVGAVQLEVERL